MSFLIKNYENFVEFLKYKEGPSENMKEFGQIA
jgi:hypothetical protein